MSILPGSLCDGCRLLDLGWCHGSAAVTLCDKFSPAGNRPFVSNDRVFDLAVPYEAPPTRADGRAVNTVDRGGVGSPPPGAVAGPVLSALDHYHRVIARKLHGRERAMFRRRRCGVVRTDTTVALAGAAAMIVLLAALQSCAATKLYGCSLIPNYRLPITSSPLTQTDPAEATSGEFLPKGTAPAASLDRSFIPTDKTLTTMVRAPEAGMPSTNAAGARRGVSALSRLDDRSRAVCTDDQRDGRRGRLGPSFDSFD